MFKSLGKRMKKYLGRSIKYLNDKTLIKAAEYSTKGGKYMRPLITVIAARSVGGRLKDALNAAASLELLHNTSLIHDDIMDGSSMRRGRLSLHRKWGKNVAITVGDANYALAFYNLSRNKNPNAMRVVQELSKYTMRICAGQLMDLRSSKNGSMRNYKKTILLKTAKGFEVATKIGAIIGGGDKAHVRMLAEYGKNLGMAFQIKDDILDIAGSEKKVGKSLMNDIREGKKTLPLIYALKKSGRKKELKRLLKQETIGEKEAREIIDIVRGCGAVEYAYRAAEKYVQKAVDSIGNLPGSVEKQLLVRLAGYAVSRGK
ncbi:MAG: polyprenyl synthetase family protein [Candidatus Aenigmarchaeota archaeon]|nr:polyprenyl synthetase family protein [Candidatus Aenigmarchaeota archaeon]